PPPPPPDEGGMKGGIILGLKSNKKKQFRQQEHKHGHQTTINGSNGQMVGGGGGGSPGHGDTRSLLMDHRSKPSWKSACPAWQMPSRCAQRWICCAILSVVCLGVGAVVGVYFGCKSHTFHLFAYS